MTGTTSPTVVLVHGGFVDGSGWQAVYDELRRREINVRVVQNPTTSLDADVAATNDVVDGQPGPVVLVGHSYGGVVVTEAGTHDNVAAVVYLAAFAPDKGESVSSLIADPPPGAPVPPILPPKNGFLFLEATSSPIVRRRPASRHSRGSWRIRRCRGASTRSTGRSPSPPGGSSRAGTSSPPRIT